MPHSFLAKAQSLSLQLDGLFLKGQAGFESPKSSCLIWSKWTTGTEDIVLTAWSWTPDLWLRVLTPYPSTELEPSCNAVFIFVIVLITAGRKSPLCHCYLTPASAPISMAAFSVQVLYSVNTCWMHRWMKEWMSEYFPCLLSLSSCAEWIKHLY